MYKVNLIPNVFRGNFQTTRQQVPKLTVFAHRFSHAGSQAINMCAILRCGDEIDVAFLNWLTALRQPADCPFGSLFIAFQFSAEGFFWQGDQITNGIDQIIAQAILIKPFGGIVSGFFNKCNV